jgi:hypothetical protein
MNHFIEIIREQDRYISFIHVGLSIEVSKLVDMPGIGYVDAVKACEPVRTRPGDIFYHEGPFPV